MKFLSCLNLGALATLSLIGSLAYAQIIEVEQERITEGSAITFNQEINLDDYSAFLGVIKGEYKFSNDSKCKMQINKTNAAQKVTLTKSTIWIVQQFEDTTNTIQKGEKLYTQYVTRTKMTSSSDSNRTLFMECWTLTEIRSADDSVAGKFDKDYFKSQLNMNLKNPNESRERVEKQEPVRFAEKLGTGRI